MINFHFDYYRPSTAKEATRLFEELEQNGKLPLYYSGGTEILTLGRLNIIHFNAVIDLKAIKDTRIYGVTDHLLVIGSCTTLNQLKTEPYFPLLGETAGRVADHTSRNKITLGGNVCGDIIYKEALLPLLLSDCSVLIAHPNGLRKIPISELFTDRMNLRKGEFILQFLIEFESTTYPSFSVKRRKIDKIDYPLLTLAALKKNNEVRVAFSGLTSFAFRSKKIDAILNQSISRAERIQQVLKEIPGPVLNDWIASDRYRLFVLQQTLNDMLQTLEKEEG